MKTRIVLVVAIAASIINCNSVMGQVKFGLKAGLNMETQSELGQLWDNDEVNTGFLVGGTAEYALTNKVSIQTEINFQKKGEKTQQEAGGIHSDISRELNYINVPLLIKGNWNTELGLPEKWNLFGYAGPYYGYLVSANEKIKTNGSTDNTNITDDSVKNDWGAVFGGGVSYKLAKGSVFADLRYDMGLYKIDNDNSDLRNKSLSLCIGFNF
jgi:opacity protein-like surface antigen